MSKKHEGLSAQKQAAISKLVNEAAGKRAVLAMVGCRYSSTKWSNYQRFLLEDFRVAHVNLDAEPNTVKVTEKPNVKERARYERMQKRLEARLAKNEAREVKKAAKAVKQ